MPNLVVVAYVDFREETDHPFNIEFLIGLSGHKPKVANKHVAESDVVDFHQKRTSGRLRLYGYLPFSVAVALSSVNRIAETDRDFFSGELQPQILTGASRWITILLANIPGRVILPTALPETKRIPNNAAAFNIFENLYMYVSVLCDFRIDNYESISMNASIECQSIPSIVRIVPSGLYVSFLTLRLRSQVVPSEGLQS